MNTDIVILTNSAILFACAVMLRRSAVTRLHGLHNLRNVNAPRNEKDRSRSPRR